MAYEKGIVATLAELEQFYKGTDTGDVLELMNQTNDILDDIPWMESNQSDGHKTRIRTGLPDVYWRRIYRGTPPSKSKWAEVKEAIGTLEALMELDIKETQLYGDKARAFRLSEGKAFTESMRQKVADTLFYGNPDANPDEFHGLTHRYPAPDAPHVIDAGGTGPECTSMWLISWGADTVSGLYPKGAEGAGLRHKDLGTYMTTDNEGRKFQVVGDLFDWDAGLAVRDWRSVTRIMNIPVAALTKRKGEADYLDLQALTVRAKNMMTETQRNKAIWYCNSEVMTGLELQSTDAGNVHLAYGEFFNSKTVPALHGRPIRQCDAILTTEEAVTA